MRKTPTAVGHGEVAPTATHSSAPHRTLLVRSARPHRACIPAFYSAGGRDASAYEHPLQPQHELLAQSRQKKTTARGPRQTSFSGVVTLGCRDPIDQLGNRARRRPRPPASSHESLAADHGLAEAGPRKRGAELRAELRAELGENRAPRRLRAPAYEGPASRTRSITSVADSRSVTMASSQKDQATHRRPGLVQPSRGLWL